MGKFLLKHTVCLIKGSHRDMLKFVVESCNSAEWRSSRHKACVVGFFVMMSVVRHVIADAPFGFIFGTRSETQKQEYNFFWQECQLVYFPKCQTNTFKN